MTSGADAPLDATSGPTLSSDLHFNRQGERIYTDRVEFIPVHEIRGWRNARGYRSEHDERSPGLIMVARYQLWAEYAIPPVSVDAEGYFPDGNHRVNAVRACGRDTLIPVIRTVPGEPSALDSYDTWLAPGIERRYALCEQVLVERHPTSVEILRGPEYLDRSLRDLLISLPGSEDADVGYARPQAQLSPRLLFSSDRPVTIALDFRFLTLHMHEANNGESESAAAFRLPNGSAATSDWEEFLSSATEPDGFSLDIPIRDLCSLRDTCNEFTLSIRAK